MLGLNKCQRSQHLELRRCGDPFTDSKEGDGQDGMGAGGEEESLGTPPPAQGLAAHGFAWLKIQEVTGESCEQTLTVPVSGLT